METNVPTLPGKTVEEAKPLIAKFQMSIKDAGYKYRDWINKQNFVSKDLDIGSNLDKIRGIWVPVWLFEVSAESAWHGEVSHTVTETKYRTILGPGPYDSKQEPYSEERTVWEPISGHHYDNYLVPVSVSEEITQKEIEALKFRQPDLKSYDESYLEGLQVLATDLNKMEAKDICNRRINELETHACNYEVERLNGCSTKVTHNTSTFALLPMFILAYTHKDKPYRNLINGLTGEVYGDKPPINKIKKFGTYAAVAIGVLIFAEIGRGLTGVPPIYFMVLAAIILYIYLRKKKER